MHNWWKIALSFVSCVGLTFIVSCFLLAVFAAMSPFPKIVLFGKKIERYVLHPWANFCRWFLSGIAIRVIFVFYPTYYNERVKKKVVADVNESIEKHRILLRDERVKQSLIAEDRDSWKDAYYKQKQFLEGDYWKGAKYGFNLAEKKLKKELSSYPSNKLTQGQLFSLSQIMKGNKSIGYNCAALEDMEYIRLIWDNQEENKFHYEITDKGTLYLGKHKRLLESGEQDNG